MFLLLFMLICFLCVLRAAASVLWACLLANTLQWVYWITIARCFAGVSGRRSAISRRRWQLHDVRTSSVQVGGYRQQRHDVTSGAIRGNSGAGRGTVPVPTADHRWRQLPARLSEPVRAVRLRSARSNRWRRVRTTSGILAAAAAAAAEWRMLEPR